MAKEWYEEDDNESVWWKATKKNARRVCPQWFEEQIGFSNSAYNEWKSLGVTVAIAGGAKMYPKIVKGAGTFIEKAAWIEAASHSLCIGAYAGGMLDGWYQTNHDGHHLGTAMADQVGDWWEDTVGWYESQEKGVENFLIRLHEWWR